MLLKRTVAASRDVAWHVYYYNRRAKPRLLATSNARQIFPSFGVRLCLRRAKSKAPALQKELSDTLIPPQGFEIWDDRVPTLSFGLFMFLTDEQARG